MSRRLLSGKGFFHAGSGAAATTWNNADKSSSFLVLSNSNRTITYAHTGNTVEGIRSVAFATTSQKVYIEHTIGTMATNWCFGFATSAAVFNVSSWTATPTFSAGYITGGSIFRCADSPDDITLSIPVLGNGDRIGIAFDTGANRMWARKNGGGWMSSAGGTQDPTAGTSGGGSRVVLTGSPFYAFCGMDANTGDSWTTNFASTDWVDAAPSGYTQLA